MGRSERIEGRVRSIGQLTEEAQARLFGDYLLSQGIHNEVEKESDSSWTIWVLDDAQLETGRGLLEKFRQNPDAAEYSRGAAQADRLRAAEAKEHADWRRRVHNRQTVFPGVRRLRAGPLTTVLIVACVAVAVFSKLGGNADVLRWLVISYSPNAAGRFLPEVFRGELWRLWSPILIHYGVGHILFNMMWLFSLGSMIESLQGTGRFALLVAVFALGSNLAEYTLGSSPYFGGMSGVNYGLIGYVWIRGRRDPASGLHLDRQNVVLAIAWFFLCFTGQLGPIANYAHAGGLLLGMAWGWASSQRS
jgi:GlpG protein